MVGAGVVGAGVVGAGVVVGEAEEECSVTASPFISCWTILSSSISPDDSSAVSAASFSISVEPVVGAIGGRAVGEHAEAEVDDRLSGFNGFNQCVAPAGGTGCALCSESPFWMSMEDTEDETDKDTST